MWVALLIVCSLLFTITPVSAEQGFDPKYERDYNIFNPLNQYRPDNPLNPINAVDTCGFSPLAITTIMRC